MKSVLGDDIPEQLVPYDRLRAEASAALVAYHQLLIMELEGFKNPDTQLGKLSAQLHRLVAPVYGNTSDYYVARIFVSLIGAFEVFLTDTVLLVLRQHPKKIGGSTFRLSEILDAESVDALVARAAEETVNALMYEKPLNYLRKLCDLVSIEQAGLEKDWLVYIEAKARRDLGVHSAWKCNQVYLRKLSEARIASLRREGETVLPNEKGYFESIVNTLESLAAAITQSVGRKHWSGARLT